LHCRGTLSPVQPGGDAGRFISNLVQHSEVQGIGGLLGGGVFALSKSTNIL